MMYDEEALEPEELEPEELEPEELEPEEEIEKRSELKPCPFCGKEPYEAFYYDGTMRTGCDNVIRHENYNEYVCQASIINPMSVEDWNTRPIEDKLQKRIAELEELLRWRPVSDGNLPAINVKVEVKCVKGEVVIGRVTPQSSTRFPFFYFFDVDEIQQEYIERIWTAIAWRPIPELDKEVTK